MKSLEEVKEEYAKYVGYESWYELYKDHVFRVNELLNRMDEVAKRYALEIAKEALKNASENAELGDTNCCCEYKCNHEVVDKQSILSETNIPELK